MGIVAPIIGAVGSVVGGVGGIGTILSIGGQLIGAAGAARQDRASAAIAAQNAAIARANADRALRASQDEARRTRREGLRRVGGLQTGFAKAGVALTGSPLLALIEQSQETEDEISQILREGESQFRNFQMQAGSRDIEAQSFRSSSQQSQIGGVLGAGTTLLGALNR